MTARTLYELWASANVKHDGSRVLPWEELSDDTRMLWSRFANELYLDHQLSGGAV